FMVALLYNNSLIRHRLIFAAGINLPRPTKQPGAADMPEHWPKLGPETFDKYLPDSARTIPRTYHLDDIIDIRLFALLIFSLIILFLEYAKLDIIQPKCGRNIHECGD